MKVKDIVKNAAVYLGLEKVVSYIENGEYSSDSNALTATDTLTRCANLVINELACTYFPMKKTEQIACEDGKAYYSSFTETPLEIKSVCDENGEKIGFTVYPEYVKTDKSTATVEYEYLPPNYDLNDTVGYKERDVPARVIAYGVAAEYLLTVRAFDESVLFHDRYEKALCKILAPKNATSKGRAFL